MDVAGSLGAFATTNQYFWEPKRKIEAEICVDKSVEKSSKDYRA
jgi:hypothetical protein